MAADNYPKLLRIVLNFTTPAGMDDKDKDTNLFVIMLDNSGSQHLATLDLTFPPDHQFPDDGSTQSFDMKIVMPNATEHNLFPSVYSEIRIVPNGSDTWRFQVSASIYSEGIDQPQLMTADKALYELSDNEGDQMRRVIFNRYQLRLPLVKKRPDLH